MLAPRADVAILLGLDPWLDDESFGLIEPGWTSPMEPGLNGWIWSLKLINKLVTGNNLLQN